MVCFPEYNLKIVKQITETAGCISAANDKKACSVLRLSVKDEESIIVRDLYKSEAGTSARGEFGGY